MKHVKYPRCVTSTGIASARYTAIEAVFGPLLSPNMIGLLVYISKCELFVMLYAFLVIHM